MKDYLDFILISSCVLGSFSWIVEVLPFLKWVIPLLQIIFVSMGIMGLYWNNKLSRQKLIQALKDNKITINN